MIPMIRLTFHHMLRENKVKFLNWLTFSALRFITIIITYIAQNTREYDLMRYTIRLSKIKYENEL